MIDEALCARPHNMRLKKDLWTRSLRSLAVASQSSR